MMREYAIRGYVMIGFIGFFSALQKVYVMRRYGDCDRRVCDEWVGCDDE